LAGPHSHFSRPGTEIGSPGTIRELDIDLSSGGHYILGSDIDGETLSRFVQTRFLLPATLIIEAGRTESIELHNAPGIGVLDWEKTERLADGWKGTSSAERETSIGLWTPFTRFRF
jgi:hypothetical protein